MNSKKRILTFVLDFILCLVFPWRWIGKRSLEGLRPRSVLFCRVDHIGDVYLSLPALARVRAHYPDARLTVLAPSWAEDLFRLAGYQDELLICDPPWWSGKRKIRFGMAGGQGGWLTLCRIVRKIRRRRFDLCIEMRGDVRQIVAFGVLGGAKHLLTRPRNGGAVLADSAPVIDEHLHECEQNLRLISALGISEQPPAFPLPFSDADVLNIRKILAEISQDSNAPTILIHPGAKWVNRWPATYYSKVIEALGQAYPRLRVLLTGAGSEAALCQQIAAALPGRAFSLAGRLTLTETAALMAQVDIVVMADTGPMHFLNAITTPAILLFGPTSPERFCPRGGHVEAIYAGGCCELALHESCSRVSEEEPSECMSRISAMEVIGRIGKRLDECSDRIE